MRAPACGLLLALALASTGCDALLTAPAPAVSEIAVSFLVDGPAERGVTRAFDKVDRVYLLFVRPDSAQRDTILRLTPSDGVARVRLVLHSDERVQALGIFAQLRSGQASLFQGQRVIRVESGTPTSTEITLSAIAAALRADRRLVSLATVGDTTRLSATAHFATGDTLATGVGTWVSEDPSIVLVTPAGLVAGRAVGETHLVVRYQGLADTILARVVAGR